MELLIIILFCFVLPFVVLIKPIKTAIKEKKNIKEFIILYKWELLLVVILIIGSLVRLVALGQIPNGLNVDEASSGYDGYSIMKYGIDRGGNSYPVYLYAWGSGQSVLYSYLMIPVLAVTGLTEYGIRLPMAIIGIISLYVFYYLFKTIFENKKIALVGTFFFAICPWHIMKSRWGMECNLFPDLILLGTLFLILGIKKKKISLQLLAFVIFSISSYSYGTSYLFLPVFILGTIVYLIHKKELTLKRALLLLLVMLVLCVPIILYIIINTFNLEQFKILGITIPKLVANRQEVATTIFSGNVFENCLNNLLDTVKLIIIQHDNLEWNAIPGYGMFYLVSIIFFIYGIHLSIKKYKDNKFNSIMNIWMLSSLVLASFCLVNINRINIIMIPCIYYVVLGLYEFFDKYKTMIPCIVIIYIYLFTNFILDYKSQDYNNYFTFTSGVKEVAEYCEKEDALEIYCQYSFKEPFIYFMFYNETNVYEYLNSVQYFKEKGIFDNIKSFGRYNFYMPEEIKEGYIVIVPNGTEFEYEIEAKEIININQFDLYKF